MVHPTVRNLSKAFKEHVQYVYTCCSGGKPLINSSARLLLFYAVECGLKALLLWRNKVNSTKDWDNTFGHDLATGLGRVDCPIRLPKTIKEKRSGVDLPISKWHEAWRYGMNLEDQKETEVTDKLQAIIKWLKDQLDEETVI